MSAASFCSVKVLSRVITTAVPLLLGMFIVSGSPSAGAVVVPKSYEIEVTGYQVVGDAGSRGPDTVVVEGPSAKLLRAALESSPPFTTRALCMEELNPFLISVLLRRGVRPTMIATAVDTCDGQYLMVTMGSRTTDVKDGCALQSAVVAALPRGQANATRMDVAWACSTTAGS